MILINRCVFLFLLFFGFYRYTKDILSIEWIIIIFIIGFIIINYLGECNEFKNK